MKMLYNRIIDFAFDAPKKFFEMDKASLKTIRQLKDATGEYLWKPDFSCECIHGTFLDIPILLLKERCLQIKYIFSDGHEHIIKFKID